VPADSRLTAQVQLTPRDIEQARLSAVEKTPYVVLAAGQIREASTDVKIKMPPEEDRLKDYFVTATLSIALSPNLQGKYEPVVRNLPEVMSRIAIRATENAKRAYEGQPYPSMTLYILDDDAKKGAGEEQRKAVVYNFPPEFVRKDEIKLKGEPVEARFNLVPVSAETP